MAHPEALPLLLSLALATPNLPAQPLDVIAPDGCIDPSALHRALSHAGIDLSPDAPWRGRIVARRVAPARWLLTVDVSADRSTHDTRLVDGCEGLSELAVLLVRNALPPMPRLASPRPSPTPPPVRVHLLAGAVLAFGMVGPWSPGLVAGVGLTVGPWRVETALGGYPPQGNAGSLTTPRTEALHGSLRGCRAFLEHARPWRLDLCFAAEFGVLGDVFAPSDPSLPLAPRALWGAIQPGVRVTWSFHTRVGLWCDAGLRIMIVNPRPALLRDDRGIDCTVHRCLDPVSSWVQPVLAAGLEVRIP